MYSPQIHAEDCFAVPSCHMARVELALKKVLCVLLGSKVCKGHLITAFGS